MFVAFAGLYPDLMFSRVVNEISYFKGAADEDFYTSEALNGTYRLDRSAADVALKIIYHFFNDDLSKTHVFAHGFFSFVTALAAYWAVSFIVCSSSTRILLAALLIFGGSIFMPGSEVVWPTALTNVISHFLIPLGKTISPIYTTFYFNIYRSPEPQTTWTWVFIALGLMSRWALNPDSRRRLLAYMLVFCFVPFFYVSCVYAIIAVQTLWLAFAFINKQYKLAKMMCMPLVCAVVALVLSLTLNKATAHAAVYSVFHSRLPVLTFSVAISLAMSVFQMTRLRREARVSIIELLSLSLVMTPMVIMNQQIATNAMVMASSFDLYINYLLLLFGFYLWFFCKRHVVSRNLTGKQDYNLRGPILSDNRSGQIRPKAFYHYIWFKDKIRVNVTEAFHALLSFLLHHTSSIMLCAVIALVALGQYNVYNTYYQTNCMFLASRKALDQANSLLNNSVKDVAAFDLSLMDNILLFEKGLKPVQHYSIAFTSPVASIESSTWVDPVHHPVNRGLFEFWMRYNYSPHDISVILNNEATSGEGYYLPFYFSFVDSWGPFSLYRSLRPNFILERIPYIVNAYTDYLSACGGYDASKPVIALCSHMDNGSKPRCFSQKLISEGSVGGTTVYAFLQSGL
jgi:hypothetical protein